MGAQYCRGDLEGDKVCVDVLEGGHRSLTGDVRKAPLENLRPLRLFDELLLPKQRLRGPTLSHDRKYDGGLHKATRSTLEG